MEMLHVTPKRPIGLAFEISDLLLLQGWAKFHEVWMVVELDHWVEGEEYEEVVAFYAKDSSLRRWILWRSASDIVVQLLIGRTCRFASVAEALDSLPATRPVRQEGGHLEPKGYEGGVVRQAVPRLHAGPSILKNLAAGALLLPTHRLRFFTLQVSV